MELKDRVEQLERRVLELEREVRRLSRTPAGSGLPAGKNRGTEARPVPEAPPEPGISAVPARAAGTENAGGAPHRPVDWEHLIARVWLPRIFMFVLLIGLLWGFKAAADVGLLSPGVRCLMGFAAGAALVYAGFRQQRRERVLLSHVLLGGSISVFMLSTFAAHNLYGYFGAFPAFALNVLWVLAGLYFAWRLGSEALAVLASLAGVLAPFLVHSSEPSPVFLAAYDTVLFTAFLLFALKQRYPKLFYIMFGLQHLSFLLFPLLTDTGSEEMAAGVLAQHLILLAALLSGRPLLQHHAKILVTSFVITGIWFRAAFEPGVYEPALLAFAAGYAALSWLVLRPKQPESLPYGLTIASYALLAYLAAVIPGRTLPLALEAQGVLAFYLGVTVRSRLQQANGLIIYTFALLLAAGYLSGGMDSPWSLQTLTWLGTLVSLGVLRRLIVRHPEEVSRSTAASVILYVMAGILLLFLADFTLAAAGDLPDQIQHLLVSLVWGLYAVAVLFAGIRTDRKQARLAGLCLLFLTLLKVIFLDLPTVALWVKAVLFIGLGAAGIGISRMFYGGGKKED
ncbi:DUF2339 domain-containing protein [Paenibacillus mucilaginosus]|uniref:Membrane protein-like protein n=3 Tax=Paenibacillus mucilaginosus TaxID=61624 RepID=H6NFZ7_9BACL|nr:DUF2339 domain-containing protein [Paenibacillus mucilaginosus]AEI43806.1 membrane protein-like protein [Paenibacillus mucilaginosus KNP414]AFC31416.1 membrane protein-like protein [Paenibacillus mucilaginosus 3016]MCG7212676.1 DUF2339 domain-containing protein [Paenibacillus mucilaginosus]WFA19965.1 DUF2339 domain-containing protein [Paenibacillus mucilaginosus]